MFTGALFLLIEHDPLEISGKLLGLKKEKEPNLSEEMF